MPLAVGVDPPELWRVRLRHDQYTHHTTIIHKYDGNGDGGKLYRAQKKPLEHHMTSSGFGEPRLGAGYQPHVAARFQQLHSIRNAAST